jgi:hypothetical protein
MSQRAVVIFSDREIAERADAALAAVGLYAREVRDYTERYTVYVIEPIPPHLQKRAP